MFWWYNFQYIWIGMFALWSATGNLCSGFRLALTTNLHLSPYLPVYHHTVEKLIYVFFYVDPLMNPKYGMNNYK